MKVTLYGLFVVILVLDVILVDVAAHLKEIGTQLHRIAFWTEDYYEEKREAR